MTAPSHRPHRQPLSAHPLVAAFVRFVVCGGGVGVASSGVLVLLNGHLPLMVANALVTVVSTVLATELHRRVSFRSGRGGWGVHLQSGLTAAVSYAFTTGALFALYALDSTPSAPAEQTVYLSASALAGVGRFALLRIVVFAERPAAKPSALGRSAVTMAA
ncbi:GtrA family protein [Streptomyces sp. NBC_00654]|uniref:GtrA family protein n=1 Tax=Streptomyces sp. NBC_00654 TaxID=2975799 RepID=UPI00225AD774|nr:GtrA family protein [Streptomyces sp. NBC_00654]MCX4965884.1 GtrA family protein [Streptomyces sp. NBC_00654]